MSTTESSSSILLLRRRRRIIIAAVFFFLIIIMGRIYTDDDDGLMEFAADKRNLSGAHNNILSFNHHRKLLLLNHGNEKEKVAEPNRIWSDKCSISDIVISQGATEPLPSGIPTYTVEIMNTSGCDISAIHLNCGWFSSVRILNPRVFKRLRFDDCLVNDGKPLRNGRTLSFQYANTFRYPLTVSSVNC